LLLKTGCERIAYVGTSKGAEAALLAAIDDPRVDAVIAVSPSSVVWAGDRWPPASSWTRNGVPVPFVEVDFSDLAVPADGRISYLSCFLKSLRRFADQIPAATIPIEQAGARVVLVAGGDDALWPSDLFARSLADRLIAAGKHPLLITHPEAGHRVLLPGDTKPRSAVNAHGGTDEADRALGLAAWKAIAEVLHFRKNALNFEDHRDEQRRIPA
jgi:dienelactone hydrolase